jgi:tight adherence protein B
MSSVPAVALTLAGALLILPSTSRSRLVASGLITPRNRAEWRARGMPTAAIVIAALAVAVVPLAVALAGATASATLLLRRRRVMVRRRVERERVALETALDVLVGELRAGAHPVAAFQSAAAEAHGAVGASFQAVAARAMLGADVAAGLSDVAAMSTQPAHWQRLAVCWELAQTHGLAMATLMRAAQRDIVERARFDARVAAGMAGARATAAVLAGLPLAGVALGELIGAHPVRFLLGGGAGGWLLLVGVGLACCGLLWSDRITGQVQS